MILTYKHDLDNVKMTQHAARLGQRSFSSKAIARAYRQTNKQADTEERLAVCALLVLQLLTNATTTSRARACVNDLVNEYWLKSKQSDSVDGVSNSAFPTYPLFRATDKAVFVCTQPIRVDPAISRIDDTNARDVWQETDSSKTVSSQCR